MIISFLSKLVAGFSEALPIWIMVVAELLQWDAPIALILLVLLTRFNDRLTHKQDGSNLIANKRLHNLDARQTQVSPAHELHRTTTTWRSSLEPGR